ncbi:MAG TPA: ABC transporter permease [Mycobacteriales bacterium]|nr:ABC transporter permease [Mycobacteriales bacterium]HWA66444.1 ABC transporter permease [Mycobacteriales bacterium]
MTSAAGELLLQGGNNDPSGTVDETAVPSRSRVVLRRFLRSPVGLIGLVFVVILVLLAYVGPLFDHWKWNEIDLNAPYAVAPSSAHWFGTDAVGHDIFATTMRGAQKSILIGLLVALLATGIAAVVGSAAGYFGGWADRVLMWCVDLLLILPSFLIIAIMSGQFDNHWWLLVVLIGMFIWQITARIVRGQTLTLKEREYVLAAKYMGVPRWRIIGRHVLPNLASLLIIDATVNVATAILTEALLSFFGFGIQPPDVSLGTLMADGQNAALTQPWLFYFPAGFLVLFVLAIFLVGDGLRDAIDPSSGKSQ